MSLRSLPRWCAAPSRTRRLVAGSVAAVFSLSGLAGCGDGQAADTTISAPQRGTNAGGTASTGGAPAVTGDATAGSTTAPSAGQAVAVEAEEVASLEAPTMLLPRPGDTGHLYATERAGRVRRLTVGEGGALSVDDEVLLDIEDQTTTESERGLLGLAFSADGKTVYVSYTDPDGNTRVVSYAMAGDAIDGSSAKVVLAQDQPFSNHNGGNVVLGPDDALWFGFGDGGAADDPGQRAQDPSTVLGKIVRIDPTGGPPEIVVHGVRNPWRFSFDTDDSLWIGDVGQNQWEEIDHLTADQIDGANLGWSGREGAHQNPGVPAGEGDARTGEDPIDPVFDYSHDGGNCSITGGFVYRGKAIAALKGAYLFTDYCAGSIRAITIDADGRFAEELDLGVEVPQPISFGTDHQGEPYVLSQGGAISRLVPAR